MKNAKLISINIAILAVLIAFFEVVSYSVLRFKKANVNGLFVSGLFSTKSSETNTLGDPCQKVKTLPYLGHAHDHRYKCQIGDAFVDGQYVVYAKEKVYDHSLITLGGSTTDGFYGSSIPHTWPEHLSSILNDEGKDLTVFNGGVGGYGSSRELLKLLIDLPRFKSKPKYILSLNGVNDIPGYRLSLKYDQDYEERYPFWNWIDLMALEKKIHVRQDKVKFFYLPATSTLLEIIVSKTFKSLSNPDNLKSKTILDIKDWEEPIYMKNSVETSVSQQWAYNVNVMHAIAEKFGAKYYVFLQPTMGLYPNQIPLKPTNKKKSSISNDYKVYKEGLLENSNLGESYIKLINKHYQSMKIECKKLSFCFDISDEVRPTGDVYQDARHHNSKGNKILANIIYDKIFR